VLVALTPAGTELLRQLRDTRRQAAEDLFLALSPADRAELTRLLVTLHDATDPNQPGVQGCR
jgi:DNA-binding MarR family transcriptional regulator